MERTGAEFRISMFVLSGMLTMSILISVFPLFVSLCQKLYPCDVCHDTQSDHDNEWANRMVCGYCSREQTFSTKPCNKCGHSLTATRTANWEVRRVHVLVPSVFCDELLLNSPLDVFWQGGKGCRDPLKMSNKDSHKWKLMKHKAPAKKS